MLFGLALLAGLVGYAVVDPFSGADESANADTDTDVSGGATDTSGNILDDLDVTTDNPEVADGDPEVVADDPDTVVDDPDVVVADPDTVITGTAEDDLIYGGDGSDILNGEAGNDELHAGDGVTGQSLNTLNGGDGDDILYGSNEAENNLNGDAGTTRFTFAAMTRPQAVTGLIVFIIAPNMVMARLVRSPIMMLPMTRLSWNTWLMRPVIPKCLLQKFPSPLMA